MSFIEYPSDAIYPSDDLYPQGPRSASAVIDPADVAGRVQLVTKLPERVEIRSVA